MSFVLRAVVEYADLTQNGYTVGYWAWELPEFPDGWMRYCDYVDEIWAPSRFARDAIAAKAPVPVLAMPHAIEFPVPQATDPRAAFDLPRDRYVCLERQAEIVFRQTIMKGAGRRGDREFSRDHHRHAASRQSELRCHVRVLIDLEVSART